MLFIYRKYTVNMVRFYLLKKAHLFTEMSILSRNKLNNITYTDSDTY